MATETSDNIATGPEPTSSGNITSGTASDAMIRAATAASSAETAPASPAGDTPAKPVVSDTGGTAGTTAQPKQDGQAATAAATRGPIPFDRHEAALRNAREKATAEVEARYAAFKDVDHGDVTVGMDILAQLRADPATFARQLMAELGLTVGKPETLREDADEAFPQPDLVSPDGKLKTYSDSTLGKILDIHARQIEKRLMGTVKPLLDDRTAAEQRTALEGRRAQTAQLVKTTLAEARKLPHFTKENEPKIIEKMRAMDPKVKRMIGPVASMYVAYNQFLAESVFPGIETAADKKVTEDNLRKARASSGSAHPVDQGSGVVKAPKLDNVNDLARHMEQMAAQAT